MKYTVDSDSQSIDWNATGNNKIVQNVCNILNLIKNEVPYARDKGRDLSNIDKTSNISRYKLIEEYEPRATVNDVKVDFNSTPNIKVVITID